MTLTASGVVDDYTTDVQRALLDELCVIIGVSCDGVTLHVQPASVRLHVRFPVASAASAASLELSLLHEVGSAEQATRWLRQAGLTQAVVESPPFFELSQPAAPSPPLGRDGGGGGIGGLVGGGAGVGALPPGCGRLGSLPPPGVIVEQSSPAEGRERRAPGTTP